MRFRNRETGEIREATVEVSYAVQWGAEFDDFFQVDEADEQLELVDANPAERRLLARARRWFYEGAPAPVDLKLAA